MGTGLVLSRNGRVLVWPDRLLPQLFPWRSSLAPQRGPTLACTHISSYQSPVTWSGTTARKVLCALPVISPSLSAPGNHRKDFYFFTISIVLPFPEYQIVGMIWYIDFSDWLFHLVII